jgi:hypothetical protein
MSRDYTWCTAFGMMLQGWLAKLSCKCGTCCGCLVEVERSSRCGCQKVIAAAKPYSCHINIANFLKAFLMLRIPFPGKDSRE